MKRHFAGMAVFLLSFAASGLIAFQVRNLAPVFESYMPGIGRNILLADRIPVRPEGKVEVSFLGFGSVDGRLALRFRITNYNDQPAAYWSFKKGEPGYSRIEVNGVLVYEFLCGTGQSRYFLEPGSLIEDEVVLDGYYGNLKNKSGNFRIQYWFKIGDEASADVRSEPIRITDSLLRQIEMTAPEWAK